jgi:hypothetical protein
MPVLDRGQHHLPVIVGDPAAATRYGTRPVDPAVRLDEERHGSAPSRLGRFRGRSDLEDVHQLLDRRRGLLEGGALGVGELDLPDLLDALGPQLGGHPDVEVVDPELAFQVAAGGQDLVLVLQTASTISAVADEGA